MADKPTPLCPLLMQVALTALLHPDVTVQALADVVSPDLTVCRGSRCAAWDPVTFPEDGGPAWGRCGMARAPLHSFPDPVGGSQ